MTHLTSARLDSQAFVHEKESLAKDSSFYLFFDKDFNTSNCIQIRSNLKLGLHVRTSCGARRGLSGKTSVCDVPTSLPFYLHGNPTLTTWSFGHTQGNNPGLLHWIPYGYLHIQSNYHKFPNNHQMHN